VALQGTLETFALPDVLRLLATTHKTGRLRITGSAGSGSLWLDGGAIVASEASRAPLATGPTDVLFELLRYKEGEFAFDDDAVAGDPGAPAEVEDTLTASEAMLEEWKTIEAVVPSLAAWVSLRPELGDDEVTLDRAHWHQVVAVAGGATVEQLGEQLGQGELAVSRTVKELVELGLVDLGDAPAGASTFVPSHVLTEPEPEAAPVAESEPPVLTVVEDPPSFESDERFDPSALVIEEPTYGGESAAAEPSPVAAAAPEDDLADAAEIARQLANLSPKAAKAVAAAAKATTDEEREAALAEVDDTEDPINRGLLLKFLGSVNG
jgi:hypothetical protein